MKFILPFILILISTNSFSKILPDNDLHKEDGKFRSLTNMTEERFLFLAEEVITHFKKDARTHGKVLTLDPKWDSSEVNAYAYPTTNRMIVEMHGGLARRPEVTEDGFQLVVCHEIGHHLAGFPLYGFGWLAASEGQSDYFATQVCAKAIWGDNVAGNLMYKSIASTTLTRMCENSYSTEREVGLCFRIGLASHSLASLLAFGNEVDFDQRDYSVVEETYTSHPDGQCRLDTYMAGNLCQVRFDRSFIPIDSDGARLTSCMRVDGFDLEARPRCWFSPADVFEENPTGFHFQGVRKKAGVYGLLLKNIPDEAEKALIYWGKNATSPFTSIDIVGNEFETEQSWGFGVKRFIRVELINGFDEIVASYEKEL